MANILIADDERTICEAFSRMVEMEGHQALIASNGKQALEIIREKEPDAVFMDVRMPGMDGLEALNRIHELNERIPVVIMTAYGTMETAMQAIQNGAFDYLGKPVELSKARQLLAQMLAVTEQQGKSEDNTQSLAEGPGADTGKPVLVGQSPAMQELFKLMGLLTTNDMTALITGESGVGKELVARGIHLHGKNKAEPFVAINCAAIPENLMESELFGHEKGAFTGADEQRQGRLELAGRGTLFLDEIGELSLSLQSKLLRVLQERSFERIGSGRSRPLQARIITATNRNLDVEVEEKRFREDLYHRLNVITLRVPPLRQRIEDIQLLARHFIRLSASELEKPLRGADLTVFEALADYSWPGNVRELEHVIKRSVLMARGDMLTLHDLQMPKNPGSPRFTGELDATQRLGQQVRETLHQMLVKENVEFSETGLFNHIIGFAEKELIDEALKVNRGNQVSTAKMLGLHRTTLRKKMPKNA